MKHLLILLFFLSIEAQAFDQSVLNDKYPQLQTYQSVLFSQLKNYFETLKQKSITFADKSDRRTYLIKKKNQDFYEKIIVQINRTRSQDLLLEDVRYTLENGFTFSYQIKKLGSSSKETPDDELLSLRFGGSKKEVNYSITIPLFKLEISSFQNDHSDISSILFGLFEYNLKIESFFGETTATRHYIYFQELMPVPQASLCVKVEEMFGEWNSLNYIHSASNLGVITPKHFFLNLGQSTQLFSEGAQLLKNILIKSGFPALD